MEISMNSVRISKIANYKFTIDNSLVSLKQLMDERQKIAKRMLELNDSEFHSYTYNELSEALKYIEINIKQILNLD